MFKIVKQLKWSWIIFFLGIIAFAGFLFVGNKAMRYTSTDEYCQSCHIHAHAEVAWKKSTHYFNKSGVKVHCVECHGVLFRLVCRY